MDMSHKFSLVIFFADPTQLRKLAKLYPDEKYPLYGMPHTSQLSTMNFRLVVQERNIELQN